MILVERFFDVDHPTFIHRHIVVGESDDFTFRFPHPCIASTRKALIALEDVSDIPIGGSCESFYDLPRAVGRIIVDYNEFPMQIGRNRHLAKAF
jgi:hypothetical protein